MGDEGGIWGRWERTKGDIRNNEGGVVGEDERGMRKN